MPYSEFICRHGTLVHDEQDDLIGRCLQLYGEWAEEEIFLLSSLIAPGDVVFDLGANIGTHSIAFSERVGPKGIVVAVEAQSRVSAILAANLKLNDVKNVRRIEGIVCERDVVVFETINRLLSNNFGAVTFKDIEDDKAEKRPLAAFRIDSLKYDQCNLIKADVEGMEVEAFKGAWGLITATRPYIYFEQNARSGTFAEIFRLFSSINFELFLHVANPFNAKNFNGCAENIFGGTCETNVLAVPRDRGFHPPPSISLERITGEDFEISYKPKPCGWNAP
jgi:FkbM family methyltransferase